MALETGTRLGPYQIESPLGAGGMGEVYKARDTRLDRRVAIKVLPGHLSDRPDLKERFDREAKAISSLSHPNICALFDVGHENGIDYLVMELLEGETLGDRLEREKLTAEKLLEIGTQIAEALDKAHRSGVVHRDLKPGNVMLTREGVKLLDFGLAKLGDLSTQPGSGSLPGLTAMVTAATPETPLTQEGTLLGTFQYMAPEQLEGKEADARTDIFALGAVLYEMATGHKAFHGDSQASLIAAIMGKEPRPISEIVAMSPPALDRVVKTCLAKDPEDRWQTAHDVALQLRWIAEGGSQAGVPAPVAARRRTRERLAWITAGVLALATAGSGALTFLNRAAPDTDVVRFQIQLPPGASSLAHPKISPDGRYVAINGQDSTGTMQIWVRRMDALQALPLPGTEDAWRPFWSPDSRYLGFLTSRGKLKKVSIQGGPSQPIGDATGYDGTWGDGFIVFDNTVTDTLQMIPSGGGLPKPCSSLDRSRGEVGHIWPYFLPDGRHYLFLSVGQDPDDRTLKVGEIGSLESRVLGNVTSRFEYVPSGHLLYVRDGVLLAHPFDAKRLEFTGDPVPVAENIISGTGTFGGSFSVSRTGVLTFWQGSGGDSRNLVWTDREGNELEVLGEADNIDSPALSPDERRVVMEIMDPRTGTPDLWMRDLVRGTLTRMTFDPGREWDPVWSPDGSRIAFGSRRISRFEVFTVQGSGGGLPDSLYGSPRNNIPTDWSRDGNWIILTSTGPDGANVVAIPSDGDGDPVEVAATEFHEAQAKLSPDGRWIAYQSNESDSREVYVQAFPVPEGKWQISTDGGLSPQWRGDGKELFYLTPDMALMSVDVNTSEGFLASVPRRLFTATVRGNPNSLNRFQVADNGQRFLFNAPVGSNNATPVTVVMNWMSELEDH